MRRRQRHGGSAFAGVRERASVATAWTAVLAAALAVSGCGPVGVPPGGAIEQARGEAPAATRAASPAPGRAPGRALPLADADLERGELLSLACKACHTLEAGGEDMQGPNLHGVFGRRAGSRAGFEYSDALRESGIVWTPETIDGWLARPAEVVPGNKMPFAGFNSASDRRDLVAYLLRETS
jgi:cytochrome c